MRRLLCSAGALLLTSCSGSDSKTTTAPPPAAPVATKLAVTTQPAGGLSGLAFTTQPVVDIQTDAGVRVATAGNAVTASIASGSGTLSGTTTVTAVGGVATFTNLVVTGTGPLTLSFTSPGLASAQSASTTVAASYDGLTITPATGLVALGGGQTQIFIVRATRGGNNVAWPGGAATWTVSSTAATATPANDSVVFVKAATTATNQNVTLTAKLGTVTGSVDFGVIAQAAAAGVTFGNVNATASSTTGTATIDVFVTDVNGAKVTGLAASSFAFTPNDDKLWNAKITPTAVATGTAATTGAFSVAVIIDQSKTMTTSDPAGARIAGAKQLVLGLTTSDEIALYSVSNTITLAQALTSSATTFVNSVNGLTVNGASSVKKIFDAGIQACQYLKANAKNTNRALVVLTDGTDYSSTNSGGDLIDACNAAGVRVYSIGFGEATPVIMGRVSTATGGYMLYADSVSAVLSGMRGMPDIVRGSVTPDRITVTFTPAAGALPPQGVALGTLAVTTLNGSKATATYAFRWSSTGKVLGDASYALGTLATAGVKDSYTLTTGAQTAWSVVAFRYSKGLHPALKVTFPNGAVLDDSEDEPIWYDWLLGATPTAGTSTIEVRGTGSTSGGYELLVEQCSMWASTSANFTGYGELGGRDCRYDGNYYAQVLSLPATKGQTMTATINSTAFKPSLTLVDPAGKWLDYSLDGTKTSATLTYTFPSTGTYVLVPTTYYELEGGAYTITVVTKATASGAALIDDSAPTTPRRPHRSGRASIHP